MCGRGEGGERDGGGPQEVWEVCVGEGKEGRGMEEAHRRFGRYVWERGRRGEGWRRPTGGLGGMCGRGEGGERDGRGPQEVWEVCVGEGKEGRGMEEAHRRFGRYVWERGEGWKRPTGGLGGMCGRGEGGERDGGGPQEVWEVCVGEGRRPTGGLGGMRGRGEGGERDGGGPQEVWEVCGEYTIVHEYMCTLQV